jgi:NAD(P)-dependent dehydrogenase (short-subunit alcohol dehydrogenase family)
MPSIPTVLIVGASRGLGYAMAAEFARRDWHVIATVRSGARAPLHDLADAYPAGVEIETLDVNDADQIAALRNRLVGRTIDILFVNAGTTTRDEHITIGAVSTEEFTHVMLTNVLGPLRVVEAFLSDLPQDALVGVMSSGQGSIARVG